MIRKTAWGKASISESTSFEGVFELHNSGRGWSAQIRETLLYTRSFDTEDALRAALQNGTNVK